MRTYVQNRRALVAAIQAILLVLATAVVYLPATQGGFIWDDDDYVVQNRTLRDWNGLKSIWLNPGSTPQYYPLVHTSFWCEYQLWELNPSGYHITNIFLHALNALLLWRLLILLSVPGAWVAAVVFAVHPVHVESVAWITERKNVLSGCFYLLCLHAYIRHWDFSKPVADRLADSPTPTGNRRRWYLLSVVCFIAALLSKTVTATLPAVILVLVWWKQGHIPYRRAIGLLPMLLVGIAFGLLTIWLEKFQVGASGIDWDLSLVERCLIAGRAIWFYAGKLVWPIPLIFTYPRWSIDANQFAQYLYPLTAVTVLISLWWQRSKIGRGPLAAVLIFIGTLFPALGFLDVYPMRFSYVADHFQYLASIAVITLIISSIATFAANHLEARPTFLTAISLSVVLMLMALTWRQSLIYEGLETLWRDTLDKNPSSFMAHNNLGALLNRRGDYKEAESHLREAMRLKPGFVDSVVNMGKAHEGQGDLNGAMTYYQQAVELNPNFAPALNGLGAMHGAKGDMQTAEEYFLKAVHANSDYVSARINLAVIYASRADHQAAINQLEMVLRQQPEMSVARDHLINAYVAAGKLDEAEERLESFLNESPGDTRLLGTLGVVKAQQQQYRAAIDCFEQVLALNPDDPNALYYLALVHRELGQVDQAEQYQRAFEETQK